MRLRRGLPHDVVVLVASVAISWAAAGLPSWLSYPIGALWGMTLMILYSPPRVPHAKLIHEASWLIILRAGSGGVRTMNMLNLRNDVPPAEAAGMLMQAASSLQQTQERLVEEAEHPKLAEARLALAMLVSAYFDVVHDLRPGVLRDLSETEKQHYLRQWNELSPETDPEVLDQIIAEYPALIPQVRRRLKENKK